MVSQISLYKSSHVDVPAPHMDVPHMDPPHMNVSVLENVILRVREQLLEGLPCAKSDSTFAF